MPHQFDGRGTFCTLGRRLPREPYARPVRVIAEFTTEPFHGEGEPPEHARRAWQVVQAAGLTGDFGPLGTEVRGERNEVLDALHAVMVAALDAGATRITLQVQTDAHTDTE